MQVTAILLTKITVSHRLRITGAKNPTNRKGEVMIIVLMAVAIALVAVVIDQLLTRWSK
jgi:hypothetical protein